MRGHRGMSLEERFSMKVDKSGPPHETLGTPCWVWTAQRRPDGYGLVCVDGRPRRAHVVSLELATGERRGSRLVCHRCDNRPCVNPEHLYFGTAATNTADLYARGCPNVALGERSSNAKLTEDLVRSVRERHAAGELLIDIQASLPVKVHPGALSRIVNGLVWKHTACAPAPKVGRRRGERHLGSKISDETASLIMARRLGGEMVKDIAASVGLSESHVSRVSRGLRRAS